MTFREMLIDQNKQRLGPGPDHGPEIVIWINSTTQISYLWILIQLRHVCFIWSDMILDYKNDEVRFPIWLRNHVNILSVIIAPMRR